MKIALVHDYLSEAGGAERVLKVFAEMYPEATIYTAFAKKGGSAYAMFEGRKIRETKLGWLLNIGRLYSYLRFLLPLVWKSLDLSEYDVVITSCSGYIARGFKVRSDTKIIAYCHTPPRWLYGYDTPTGAHARWWGKSFMWIVGPYIRYFDFNSAKRVDVWIANSREVARRIQKFYRKVALVIYPPIEVEGSDNLPAGNYYLMLSRIVGGKGILEADTAFKQIGRELKIVGEVVDTKLAKSVMTVGRVDDSELREIYSRAKGFVALSRDEDFGMTVVEAMMQGIPVLAYNGGGYRETVIEGVNGILIDGLDSKSIALGIEKMEKIKWNRVEIRKSAKKFGRARFEKEMREVIEHA